MLVVVVFNDDYYDDVDDYENDDGGGGGAGGGGGSVGEARGIGNNDSLLVYSSIWTGQLAAQSTFDVVARALSIASLYKSSIRW